MERKTYPWHGDRDQVESRLRELAGVAAEGREFSPQDRAEIDALKMAVDDLDGRVGQLEAIEGEDEDATSIANDAAKAIEEAAQAGDRAKPAPTSTRLVKPWLMSPVQKGNKMESLRSWFRIGTELESRQDFKAVAEAGATSQLYEFRTGLVSNAPSGSNAVPISTLSQFETLLTSYCDWLAIARVIRTTTGEELRIPVDATARQTTGAEIASFINEATPDSDKSVVLEKRVLKSFMATSGIQRLSIELLADSAINIEQLVIKQLATRIGRLLSKVFTVGTGVNEPTGLLDPSSAIPVVNSTAAGAIGLDDLIGAFSQLDPAHQADPSCRWMMSPGVWGALLKLKDAQNRPYFFSPANGSDVTGPASGYILGKAVTLNPHMESTITSGKPAIVVGAFSEYAIRQAGSLQLRKSDQAFWSTREVGYNSILRIDGKVLDPEAFRQISGK